MSSDALHTSTEILATEAQLAEPHDVEDGSNGPNAGASVENVAQKSAGISPIQLSKDSNPKVEVRSAKEPQQSVENREWRETKKRKVEVDIAGSKASKPKVAYPKLFEKKEGKTKRCVICKRSKALADFSKGQQRKGKAKCLDCVSVIVVMPDVAPKKIAAAEANRKKGPEK